MCLVSSFFGAETTEQEKFDTSFDQSEYQQLFQQIFKKEAPKEILINTTVKVFLNNQFIGTTLINTNTLAQWIKLNKNFYLVKAKRLYKGKITNS